MSANQSMDRRQFITETAFLGAALGVGPVLAGAAVAAPVPALTGKVKVAEIGCGNVSGSYLPNLTGNPHIEVVAVCDIILDRAKQRAQRFQVPNVYPNIDELLGGVPFDLLVNTTSMPSHYPVNKKALEAKRHVWS